MKISESKLRKIIRKVLKEQMISIVRNDYEDVEDINILANYALRNDMQGALKDPDLQYYIDKNEMGYLVDDSWGWLKHVGDEERHNMPAPEGWDLKKVTQFFKDFENEAYSAYSKKSKTASDHAPNLPERTALGSAFTMGPLLPEDIQHITYQARRKGGKINWIMLEDDGGELGHMSTGIDASDAKQYQTDLDKIIKVLEDNGATGRKKRKPVKHTPPIYD
jgi:hypothetical protein